MIAKDNAGWAIRMCVAIVAAALLAASIRACMIAGPWYDEFYTLYVTRPELGGWDALVRHWLPDNHPPLFYGLTWLTSWLGEAIEYRRLVNVIIFLAGGGALLMMARRWPEWRLELALFFILLASSQIAILQISELRSNYLAFMSAAIATALLAISAQPHQPKASFAQEIALTAALGIAFNVHFAATVLTGSVAAAFGLRLIMEKDWKGAARLLAIGSIAALPIVATVGLQFARIEANTRSFWIPAGLDAARWSFEHAILGALSANLIGTLAGMAGLALLAWQFFKTRRMAPQLAISLTLAAGCIAGIAILTGLHLWRPIVIERYLVALVPPIFLAFAIGSAVLVRRYASPRNLLIPALIAFTSLLAIAAHLRELPRKISWNGTAQAITGEIAQCPDTLVHPDLRWNRDVMALPPAENRKVVPFAYRLVAQRHGFEIEPRASRRMSRTCPTIFWTEHASDQKPSPEQVAASLKQRGYAIGDYEMRRIQYGWIFISRPQAARIE